jgi:hypothetical protein
MKTNAVHETFRLLPADSVAYRCNPPVFGRKTKNPPMAAHLRWAESMSDPQWGWRVAMTHHASQEPLPPSVPKWSKEHRWITPGETAAEHEQDKSADIDQIIQDFVLGKKRNRLQHLAPEDHR